MKKFLKYTLGVAALIATVLMLLPNFSFAAPLVADLHNMLPDWLNHLLPSVGAGATTAQFLPNPGQPIAPLNKPTPSVAAVAAANGAKTNVAYGTNGGEKQSVRIIQDNVGQLSFVAVYTVGGTYVANTAIPIIPRLAADALPTGITFASANFTNFAAFTGFYAGGLKFALFGTMVFNVSNNNLLQSGAIQIIKYNDANITMSNIVTAFSQAAPNWTNQFQLNEQFISDTNWLTGDLNNQILMQLPATTGTMTITYYVKATTQSRDVAQSIQ